MQSTDERDQVVQTAILQATEHKPLSQRVAGLLAQAEKKGAVKHVIAPLPAAGSIVEILGLRFKVTFSSPKRGKLHLELEQPAESA